MLYRPSKFQKGGSRKSQPVARAENIVFQDELPTPAIDAPIVSDQQVQGMLSQIGEAIKPDLTSYRSNYRGTSVVDALKNAGKGSSYSDRAQLAASLGIKNYSGTAKQNIELLNLLRGNTTPIPVSTQRTRRATQQRVAPTVSSNTPQAKVSSRAWNPIPTYPDGRPIGTSLPLSSTDKAAQLSRYFGADPLIPDTELVNNTATIASFFLPVGAAVGATVGGVRALPLIAKVAPKAKKAMTLESLAAKNIAENLPKLSKYKLNKALKAGQITNAERKVIEAASKVNTVIKPATVSTAQKVAKTLTPNLQRSTQLSRQAAINGALNKGKLDLLTLLGGY